MNNKVLDSIDDLDFEQEYLIPLGSQSEIGCNMYLLIWHRKIIIIDCGSSKPKNNLPGIDVVIPNIKFLKNNESAICGLVISQASLFSMGSIFYLLKNVKINKVYSNKFVIDFLNECYLKLDKSLFDTDFLICENTLSAGEFSITINSLNQYKYSIVQIETDFISIVYCPCFNVSEFSMSHNDFALLSNIKQNSKKLILLTSSNNIELDHNYVSFNDLQNSFENIINQTKSSHRYFFVLSETTIEMLEIFKNLSTKFNLNIVVQGVFIEAAIKSYNLNFSNFQFCNLKDYPDNKSNSIILFGCDYLDEIRCLSDLISIEKYNLSNQTNDIIVFCNKLELGTKRLFARLCDILDFKNIKIYYESNCLTSISKFPTKEDIVFLVNLFNPTLFIPINGEYRHNYQLVKSLDGIIKHPNKVVTLDNGNVLNIAKETVEFSVDNTFVYLNQNNFVTLNTKTLKERKNLAYDGFFTISLVLEQLTLVDCSIIESAIGIKFSAKWQEIKQSINMLCINHFQILKNQNKPYDLNHEIELLRHELITMLKQQLYKKPYLNILISQI